jgi:5-formyltetrahydrofolate cyclo-ligase
MGEARPAEEGRPLGKPELRRRFKATIAALPPEARRHEEDALAARIAVLPGFAVAETVLLFVGALPEEPRTKALFSAAYVLKKRVLCPRVDRVGRRLRLYAVSDPASELEPGALSIPEPKPGLPEIAPELVDWALVPGLAFDEQGYRLGRGAGYYDRLIPRLRGDATCWAVCLSCQLVAELPREPHDAPLDGITSPDKVVRGRRGNW